MSLSNQEYTDRNGSEGELTARGRAAVGRYRLFEPLTEGFLVLDADWCVAYLNPAAARILGKARPEVLDSNLWVSIPEMQGAEWEAELRAAVDLGEVREFRAYFAPSRTWLEGRADPTEEGLCLYLRETESLRTPHDTFRYLIENSQFGVYAVDADFRLIQVSAGARKVFENVHPLIGRDFAEALHILWPEPFASEAIGRFRHTLETGEPYHAPSTVERRHDSGDVESYDWKIERVMLPDGRFGVVCHFYDLSERERYEAQLRSSEERLRIATEAAGMFTWESDPSARTIRWSENAAAVIGCRPDELPATMGEGLFFVAPEDAPRVQREFDEAIGCKRDSFHQEFRGRGEPSSAKYFQAQARLLYDAQGALLRVIGVTQDITERKRAEDALRYRSAQFETLLNQAPLAVYLIDADLRVIAANPIVLASVGDLPGGLIGRDFDEVGRLMWEKEFADRIIPIFRRTLETGEPYSCSEEKSYSHTRQETGYFEWQLNRITLPDGRYGLVCYVRNITPQVIARHALEESEELFRTLSEGIPLHVWMISADGQPLYRNPAWRSYAGLPSDGPIPGGWESLYHPDEVKYQLPQWEEAVRLSQPLDVETRIRRHDGVYRWFACRTAPVKDGQGRVITWVGTALDIEERKQGEEAQAETARSLARERERLAVALRTGQMGVYEWRVGDTAVWWSPELYLVYGVEPESFAPTVESFSALIHPEDREELWRKTDESIAGREVFVHEYRVIPPDGRVRWVANRSHVTLDAAGNPERITGVAADITERKEAELAHAQLSAIVESSADAIYLYDLEGTILTWNRSAEALYGYKAQEIIGQNVAKLLTPDRKTEAQQVIIPAIRAGGSIRNWETMRMRRDGSLFAALLTASPIHDAAGRPVALSVIVSDISVQKQARQEIADLNVRLKRAIAETHHRVKNNLQTLSALMEMQLPDAEEAMVPASSVRRVWQHIRTLASLHQLLTQESKFAADQDTISLRAALEKLVPLLEATAGSRHIRVRADAVNIPLRQGGSFVLLVNELVSNALKHGEGDIVVILSAVDEAGKGRTARLEVHDDGPGFPPNFDPARAANMGLELVESLAGWDLLGQIAYANREEGGGCVIVTFPLPDAQQE